MLADFLGVSPQDPPLSRSQRHSEGLRFPWTPRKSLAVDQSLGRNTRQTSKKNGGFFRKTCYHNMQQLFLGKMMFIRILFSSRRESQFLNNVLNYGILGYRDFQTQTHVTVHLGILMRSLMAGLRWPFRQQEHQNGLLQCCRGEWLIYIPFKSILSCTVYAISTCSNPKSMLKTVSRCFS